MLLLLPTPSPVSSLPTRIIQGIRIIPGIFICLIILIGFGSSVNAQEIIVHQFGCSWEDGDKKLDADGIKNQVVVFKAGAVHVVVGDYSVYPVFQDSSMALIVEPGAIIKMASKFEKDQDGKLQWAYGGRIESGPKAYMKLDGVTITDIRDDEVGGDVNQDGGAQTPDQRYVIQMSGNDQDILQNCRIKHCVKIGNYGSIHFADNYFIDFGGLSSNDGFPRGSGDVVLNAVPVFTGNNFDMTSVSFGGGALDLTGMSPVFEGNTIRGASTAILVGTRFLDGSYPDEPSGPVSGTAIITNNTIVDCDNGIQVKEYGSYYPDTLISRTPPFNVSIRNNIITGRHKGYGILVGFSNNAEVLGNEVSNFQRPIGINFDYRYQKFNDEAVNGLRINYNKFYDNDTYPGVDSIKYKYWSRGIFVDAKFNYWGDASGPKDKSSKDGFYNPYGKGLEIGNGIDYSGFIGGSVDPVPDNIKIEAKANPLIVLPYSDELAPEVNYDFQVKVTDYKLKSSPTGKIAVMIRDESGTILNGTGTIINVTNSASTLEVPPITVQIPDVGSKITVEASLAPDAENALTVYSNQVVFKVRQAPCSFEITGIKDLSSQKYPDFYEGANVSFRFDFTYNLSGTGNGRLEIDLKIKDYWKGTVVNDLPLETVDIKAGTKQKTGRDIKISLPEGKKDQYFQVTYKITMKNDKGEKSGGSKTGFFYVRKRYSQVYWARFDVGIEKNGQLVSAGRKFFETGEIPLFALQGYYIIEKPDVTNWQIKVGPFDVYDKFWNLLFTYNVTFLPWTNLKTTGRRWEKTSYNTLMIPGGSQTLPPEAKYLRFHMTLIDPAAGDTMANFHPWLYVRPVPKTEEKFISPGAAQVAFDQIPVKLNFKSSSSSGKVTASEFQEQFKPSLMKTKVPGIASQQLFQKFIPLNRFWSVYDSLKEGSYSCTITITYDPQKDFPFTPDFNEDSLVITSVNPNNSQLEELPSVLNKTNHTITTDYLKFYDTYIIASRTSSATGIDRKIEGPAEFTLSQNYPNPFNPATTISFYLPLSGSVKLHIYNILGQIEGVLADGFMNRGEHNITWNINGKSSGVYIARLEYNGKIRYIKMIALK